MTKFRKAGPQANAWCKAVTTGKCMVESCHVRQTPGKRHANACPTFLGRKLFKMSGKCTVFAWWKAVGGAAEAAFHQANA